MINMTQFTQSVANNTVVVNGATFNNISDDVAMKIMELISGKVIGTSSEAVNDSNTTKQYKPINEHIDDMSYKVEKLTNSTDNKDYYCIGYVAPAKFHMTKDLRAKVNAGIKALDKIETITVKYTDKDGVAKQYKAWGYKTKATAEKKVATLATSFDYIRQERIK